MSTKLSALFVVLSTLACTGGTSTEPVLVEEVEIPTTTPDLPVPTPEQAEEKLPPREREATLANHCTDEEVVVFSCKIEEKDKYVSLCRSPVLSNSEGFLVYRFGSKGSVELEYPNELGRPSQSFTFDSWSQSPRVSGMSVMFTNEGHKFDLYDAFFHGEQSNGIIITTPADKKIEFACEQPIDFYSSDITHVLPNQRVVAFHQEMDQLEANLKKNRHCLDEEVVEEIEDLIYSGRKANSGAAIMIFNRDTPYEGPEMATCDREK